MAAPNKTGLKDRTGERVGPLLVTGRGENQNGNVRWLATCVCGRNVILAKGTLARMADKDPASCGCNRLRAPDPKLAEVDRSRLRAMMDSEKGKDDWQIEVLRQKKRRQLARARC